MQRRTKPVRRLRLGLAVLVATIINVPVVGWYGNAGARAAEPSADIPGIPLPGPISAGRLGGAIYDVVYQVSVAPGFVIVASLTGTAGTDFDMYLFDSSATTVLAETGLLTKSLGPTSSESVSWPSQFGGTYYLDLNGATDVEGDYRLTVQTVPDPSPPTLSIALADGRASTNQASVPVALQATDDLSGVREMALSNDGVTFESWRPFAPTTTWSFPARDGAVTLWAKVRNGVGLESIVAVDSITIDTVRPTVVSIEPEPGAKVSGLRPVFAIGFSEPVDPGSWRDLGLIVQAADGSLVGGTYTYDPRIRTGYFQPSNQLAAGATYIVTVGYARDVAGNLVTSPGSWSVVPQIPTKMSVVPKSGVFAFGSTTTIDFTLSGAPMPATVTVESVTTSGSLLLTTLQLAADHGSLVVAPQSNTVYRFSYSGAVGVAPATAEARVLVRRSVALVGLDAGNVARAKVGSTKRLVSEISPPAAGVRLSFGLYRFDPNRRRWIYAGSYGRTSDSTGRASLGWTPSGPGSFYWRVVVSPTPGFANNVSAVYRWSVRP